LPGLANPTAAQLGLFVSQQNQRNAIRDAYSTFITVREALRSQIIAAIDNRYLDILSDVDLGFADVTPMDMLAHLKTSYGTLSMDDLEANRNLLAVPMDLDHGLEALWIRIKEVQRIAQAGNQPISNATAIALTLPIFDSAGTFTADCYDWRKRSLAAQSDLTEFQRLFNLANKERIRQITAKGAGFHGANLAASPPLFPPDQHAANAVAIVPVGGKPRPANEHSALVGETRWYYCHTHGLGPNPEHTSATCKNPGENHQPKATINNMMGGCNLIAHRSRGFRGGIGRSGGTNRRAPAPPK
jgi:hypothetical protein